MDEHYDTQKAKTFLETYINLAAAQATNGLESGGKQLTNVEIDEFVVGAATQPSCWRLTIPASDMTVGEEVIFRMQGIVTDKDLPPVNKMQPQKAERMRPHMRQAITITGLGIPSFDKALETIEKIQIAFLLSIGEDELVPLQPASFQGNFAIDAHNRYFSKKHFVPAQEPCAFHPAADPYGVLASLENREFIHIEDNHVDYLGPTNSGGVIRIGPINPSTIAVGDIVEIGVSFVAFPTATNKARVMSSLRSIRILDRDCRNTASILAMRAKYTHKITINPKRKATYSDEELAGMEKTMSKMRMEE